VFETETGLNGVRNRRLVTVLAVVGVAAVALGGFAASRRSPHADPGSAAPLATPSTSASPSPPPFTGPATVPVDARKLPVGAAPKVTYLRDRTVLGGTGTPLKIPGSVEIDGVGRLRDAVLTIQAKNVRSSSLVILDASGKQIGQVPGVDSLVTSADSQAAAYASGGHSALETKGGTVYFQRSPTQAAIRLPQPKVEDLLVLGVTDDTVYFRAGGFDTWQFYRWQVDQPKATLISKVPSPTTVSADGRLVAGLGAFNDGGMCTLLMSATTGTQRWRTCQSQLTRFSPGDVFAVGIPPGSAPYGDLETVALSLKTGDQLRKWTGPSLRDSIAEDDDHLLLQWHDQPDPVSRSALVRCTVSSGKCELATPLAAGQLLLGT
jgi:hypothetical protein